MSWGSQNGFVCGTLAATLIVVFHFTVPFWGFLLSIESHHINTNPFWHLCLCVPVRGRHLAFQADIRLKIFPMIFFYWKSNPMNLNPGFEVQTLLFLYRCILDSSFNLFGIRIRQHIKNSYGFKYIPIKVDQRFMNILQISNLFK